MKSGKRLSYISIIYSDSCSADIIVKLAGVPSGAPNENIVHNHLNIALLNVF